MRKKNYSTASNEHGSTKAYKFNVELPTVRQARHLPLIVFQLLIRCVHPRASDILRTWSTIARSVILCIIFRFYLCVYHSLQVHRWWAYWQAQRTSVSKDESTESMISKRVQRSTQWLVHGSPSGSIGLPEAVHQVVSKGAILVIHRESTVPTVEVLLQLKLSAFTRRTDEAVSKQCNSDALNHPPDRRSKAMSVSAPARWGKSLQTPSWLSVRHLGILILVI